MQTNRPIRKKLPSQGSENLGDESGYTSDTAPTPVIEPPTPFADPNQQRAERIANTAKVYSTHVLLMRLGHNPLAAKKQEPAVQAVPKPKPVEGIIEQQQQPTVVEEVDHGSQRQSSPQMGRRR